MQRKSDDLAIGAFFDELASQPWLGHRRRFWPRCFFHITHIENAASILRSGQLLSRSRALAVQCMVSDNASPDVLEQSPPWLFDHVRLYFRPRTPTFYRNEGIRPPEFRTLGAHCPMPVALLFDAKSIAGRTGTRFSDRRLASRGAMVGEDVVFLRSLDFQEVYHEGSMSPEFLPRLRARRQAEIFVPGQLPLDDLRFVVTRSEAERLTLLTLLADSAWTRPPFLESVLVDPNLFYGEWTYVERVTLTGDRVRILFNPDTQTPGPFGAHFAWTNPRTGASTMVSGPLRGLGAHIVDVPSEVRGTSVQLTLHLDDALAFSGLLEHVPSSTLLEPR